MQKPCGIVRLRLLVSTNEASDQACDAGMLQVLEPALRDLKAAQLQSPAEVDTWAWHKALDALLCELEAFPAPSMQSGASGSLQAAMAGHVARSAPDLGSDSCTYNSSAQGLGQALQMAWKLGLYDNAVAGLQTLQDWIRNAQEARVIADFDVSRHPDSLPWDCDVDAVGCHAWQHAERGQSVSRKSGIQGSHGQSGSQSNSSEHVPVILDLLSAEHTRHSPQAPGER